MAKYVWCKSLGQDLSILQYDCNKWMEPSRGAQELQLPYMKSDLKDLYNVPPTVRLTQVEHVYLSLYSNAFLPVSSAQLFNMPTNHLHQIYIHTASVRFNFFNMHI